MQLEIKIFEIYLKRNKGKSILMQKNYVRL